MKRLLVLFILLLALPAQAADYSPPLLAMMGPMIMGGGVSGGSPATFCTSTTQTANGTNGRLCEDVEASTACWDGDTTAKCRQTWALSGTLDYAGTPIDGSYSLNIDGSGSAVEYMEYDTGDASGTFSVFFHAKINGLGGAARQMYGVADTSLRAYCELDNNGKMTAYAGSRQTASTLGVSVGNSYYFWGYYDNSSGASDGTMYCCFSTTTTQPATPTSNTDNCSSTTAHNVTNTVDRWRFTNGYSTTYNSYNVDNIFISTSEIGSNP